MKLLSNRRKGQQMGELAALTAAVIAALTAAQPLVRWISHAQIRNVVDEIGLQADSKVSYDKSKLKTSTATDTNQSKDGRTDAPGQVTYTYDGTKTTSSYTVSEVGN